MQYIWTKGGGGSCRQSCIVFNFMQHQLATMEPLLGASPYPRRWDYFQSTKQCSWLTHLSNLIMREKENLYDFVGSFTTIQQNILNIHDIKKSKSPLPKCHCQSKQNSKTATSKMTY